MISTQILAGKDLQPGRTEDLRLEGVVVGGTLEGSVHVSFNNAMNKIRNENYQ